MTLEITSSLDWHSVQTELLARASKLNCFSDTLKLLNNLEPLIAKLGKAEIDDRRNYDKPSRNTIEMVTKINEEINNIDKMLMFAALYK